MYKTMYEEFEEGFDPFTPFMIKKIKKRGKPDWWCVVHRVSKAEVAYAADTKAVSDLAGKLSAICVKWERESSDRLANFG